MLPMADAPRRTDIVCDQGTLPFQNWFVQQRAESPVREVRFEGASDPTPEVLAAIDACDLVIVGPSNPYVSIDPILTLTGVRQALAKKKVIAVSPIVGGRAVKGPLASMIRTLAEREPSAGAVADHYDGLLAGIVVEQGDEAEVKNLPVRGLSTIMGGGEDRERLAREVLKFAGELQ